MCATSTRHPQFDLKTLFAHRATADVALMKLARPLPADILPAVLGKDIAPQVGAMLTVFGYGLAIRGDGRAAARCARRNSPSPAVRAIYRSASSTRRPKARRRASALALAILGAPVFSGTVLIGVVSWSTGPNMEAGCGGMTGVTPIALYRAWIVDAARRLGSPLPD